MGKPTTKPAWVKNQQKNVNTINSEQRLEQTNSDEVQEVTIMMKSDYRDVVKSGQLYTTDAGKANELVSLGRAEYVTK